MTFAATRPAGTKPEIYAELARVQLVRIGNRLDRLIPGVDVRRICVPGVAGNCNDSAQSDHRSGNLEYKIRCLGKYSSHSMLGPGVKAFHSFYHSRNGYASGAMILV